MILLYYIDNKGMKALQEALSRKKIDFFIKEYEMMSENQSKQHERLKEQYLAWKKIVSNIDSLLKKAGTNKNWLTHSSRNEQVYTAAFRSKGKFQIKSQLRLTTGLQILCKLLANTESYQHFLPFCESCKELRVQSPWEKDLFMKFKIPFLNDRYMAARVSVIDRIQENKSIVIYGCAIKGKEIDDLVRQANGQLVKLREFITQVKVNKDQYTVLCYGVLDDTLSLIPNLIVKKLLQISSAFLLSKVLKIVERIDTSLDKFTTPSNEVNKCIQSRLLFLARL